jgi:hypothetical protein
MYPGLCPASVLFVHDIDYSLDDGVWAQIGLALSEPHTPNTRYIPKSRPLACSFGVPTIGPRMRIYYHMFLGMCSSPKIREVSLSAHVFWLYLNPSLNLHDMYIPDNPLT